MRLKGREHGFGLVAAMFLIIIVALVIAAMSRLATTQNATNSMAIQQARAYQSARAGIEYGISRVLSGPSCPAVIPTADFTLDGFQVRVEMPCTPLSPVAIPEEDKAAAQFFTITATAQFGAPGQPDYAYRRLTSVVERPSP